MIDGFFWLRTLPARRLAERKQAREVSGRITANFVVGFVLRLQSDLVHFANDDLTKMEITAQYGRVCSE